MTVKAWSYEEFEIRLPVNSLLLVDSNEMAIEWWMKHEIDIIPYVRTQFEIVYVSVILFFLSRHDSD